VRTEDGDLIHQCLNGDSAAFGFLVNKYKEPIYASAYAKVSNFADAQDLTQEVFIKAYQNLGHLKCYDRFGAWLYAITSNLAKDFLRSKMRRPDREFVEGVEQEVIDRLAIEIYYEKKANEPLYEALEALPEIYRQVLSLYYLAGMNSKEISRFLGTSTETINMRLSRARKKLKEEMTAIMSTTFDKIKLQPGLHSVSLNRLSRLKSSLVQREYLLGFRLQEDSLLPY
jgi:RNA polymerase sigma-70 factor (ECF subfamily)